MDEREIFRGRYGDKSRQDYLLGGNRSCGYRLPILAKRELRTDGVTTVILCNGPPQICHKTNTGTCLAILGRESKHVANTNCFLSSRFGTRKVQHAKP